MFFCINGNFLCRDMTGIERFAWEVCTRLDSLCRKGELRMYVPKNARRVPQFKNIAVIVSRHDCRIFPVWDHLFFTQYLKKTGAVALDFSNTTPFFNPGIAFLHDLYAKQFPADFATFKDRLIRLYSLLMYRTIARRAQLVCTVSEFSKKQIMMEYGTAENKIVVIPNGWDHFRDIVSDKSIFERFPQLVAKRYYFTLGSLSKRKNLKWIAQYAEHHPDELFAVSGKPISGLAVPELQLMQTLPNIVFTGYASDGEIKALMTYCKAFIFPSYYEGFGIPPLEALSCGAPAVVARSASLPEIFGSCVHYIDPENPHVDISDMLSDSVAPAQLLLQLYTYDVAAKKLYALLQSSAIILSTNIL